MIFSFFFSLFFPRLILFLLAGVLKKPMMTVDVESNASVSAIINKEDAL